MNSNSTGTVYRCSAPGKVIINGEHAVVYGKKAIASAIDLRTEIIITNVSSTSDCIELHSDVGHKTVSIYKSEDVLSKLTIISSDSVPNMESLYSIVKNDVGLDHDDKDVYSLALVTFCFLYAQILYKKHKLFFGMNVEIRSVIPVRQGLGSSASYCSCVAALLLKIAGEEHDLGAVYNWALKAEHIIHGVSSGVDVAIAVYGNFLCKNTTENKILDSFLRLKVLLVETSVERNTKEMVERVKQLHDSFPGVINPIFDAIGEITNTEIEMFSSDNYKDLNKKINKLQSLFCISHNLLCSLGVGHPKITQVSTILQRHNVACKITGAGGGGVILALPSTDMCEEDIKAVQNELLTSGFKSVLTEIGASGIKIDE